MSALQGLPLLLPPFDLPDIRQINKGLGGADWLTKALTNSVTYTIPANKVFAVHGIYSSAANAWLVADSVAMIYPGSAVKMCDRHRLVATSGTTVATVTGSNMNSALSTSGALDVIAEHCDYLFCFKAGTVLASNNSSSCHLLGTLHSIL